MSTRDEEFFQRLRAVFRIEAAEHAQTIATGLLEIEKQPSTDLRRTIIESIFRAAHSLKGAARAVDFAEIEAHCQALEDLFASWKKQETTPSADALDSAHKWIDAIAGALGLTGMSRETSSANESREKPQTNPRQSVQAPPPQTAAGSERKSSSQDETVRISIAKLDARLLEAEEMLTVKLTTAQRASDLRDLAQRFERWKLEWSTLESDARALRTAAERPEVGGRLPETLLKRVVDFLDWNVHFVKQLERKTTSLTRKALQDSDVAGKLVDDLLEDSKRLLLLPFGTLTPPFPKLVRDLCRDQGKEATLIIRGEDVEIDKRILEEMKDPLVHLLRNAVDHGVETADVRKALGKPSAATITLTVSHLNGNKVEIRLTDDGKGIDTEAVKKSAVGKHLMTSDEAGELDEEATQDLVFQADVSTSSVVSHLSGRGLGLAIVRERAEKLGGMAAVESRQYEGTTFRIILPSMLATFRGVLIEEAGRLFVMPIANVERVARVKAADVQTVEGRETISLGGRAIALARLGDLLELAREREAGSGDSPAHLSIAVVSAGELRAAIVVDEVLEEQEVLVKPLRKPLSRVRNISGATVLGSGQVVPVLNVPDLLKTARASGGRPGKAAPARERVESKRILVVEDSITSRMLIASILESAGYIVKTAVDGVEAYTILREEAFDLVVSDVEMPRLNGFDLTARIRADKQLAELPVVLVTALDTREDRERGIGVGASAYIVKSKFDQSNLLEAVERLL